MNILINWILVIVCAFVVIFSRINHQVFQKLRSQRNVFEATKGSPVKIDTERGLLLAFKEGFVNVAPQKIYIAHYIPNE